MGDGAERVGPRPSSDSVSTSASSPKNVSNVDAGRKLLDAVARRSLGEPDRVPKVAGAPKKSDQGPAQQAFSEEIGKLETRLLEPQARSLELANQLGPVLQAVLEARGRYANQCVRLEQEVAELRAKTQAHGSLAEAASEREGELEAQLSQATAWAREMQKVQQETNRKLADMQAQLRQQQKALFEQRETEAGLRSKLEEAASKAQGSDARVREMGEISQEVQRMAAQMQAAESRAEEKVRQAAALADERGASLRAARGTIDELEGQVSLATKLLREREGELLATKARASGSDRMLQTRSGESERLAEENAELRLQLEICERRLVESEGAQADARRRFEALEVQVASRIDEATGAERAKVLRLELELQSMESTMKLLQDVKAKEETLRHAEEERKITLKLRDMAQSIAEAHGKELQLGAVLLPGSTDGFVERIRGEQAKAAATLHLAYEVHVDLIKARMARYASDGLGAPGQDHHSGRVPDAAHTVLTGLQMHLHSFQALHHECLTQHQLTESGIKEVDERILAILAVLEKEMADLQRPSHTEELPLSVLESLLEVHHGRHDHARSVEGGLTLLPWLHQAGRHALVLYVLHCCFPEVLQSRAPPPTSAASKRWRLLAAATPAFTAAPRRDAPADPAAAASRAADVAAAAAKVADAPQGGAPAATPPPAAGRPRGPAASQPPSAPPVHRKSEADFVAVPPKVADAIRMAEADGWESMVWTDNFTLLHWAARANKPKICHRLMELRADPHLLDLKGRSSLHYAEVHESAELFAALVDQQSAA